MTTITTNSGTHEITVDETGPLVGLGSTLERSVRHLVALGEVADTKEAVTAYVVAWISSLTHADRARAAHDAARSGEAVDLRYPYEIRRWRRITSWHAVTSEGPMTAVYGSRDEALAAISFHGDRFLRSLDAVSESSWVAVR